MSFRDRQFDSIADSIISAALRSSIAQQDGARNLPNDPLRGISREPERNVGLACLPSSSLPSSSLPTSSLPQLSAFNAESLLARASIAHEDANNPALSASPSRNHEASPFPSSVTISASAEPCVPEMSRIELARLAAAERAVASASRRTGNKTSLTATGLFSSLKGLGPSGDLGATADALSKALRASFLQQKDNEKKTLASNNIFPNRTAREQLIREETHRELVEKLLLVQREKELQLERIEELKRLEELRHKRLMRSNVVTQTMPNVVAQTMPNAVAQTMPSVTQPPEQSMPTKAAPTNEPSPCRWWVCSHCQSRAFSDRSEAREHEAVCEKNKMNIERNAKPNPPIPVAPQSRDCPNGQAPGQDHKESNEMSRQDHNNCDKFSQKWECDDLVVSTPSPARGLSTLTMCIPLSNPDDQKFISPFECFVRCHCVRVFVDVASDNNGSETRVVGLRCPYCPGKSRGSVFYPPSLANLYDDSMKLLQGHVAYCASLPYDVAARYRSLLRTARPGYDAVGRRYWIESAKSIGLKDRPGGGICFELESSPRETKLDAKSLLAITPPSSCESKRENEDIKEPESGEPQGESTNPSVVANSRAADASTNDEEGIVSDDTSKTKDNLLSTLPPPDPCSLVQPEDSSTSTYFSYFLLAQMRRCSFTEADRLGKRKGLPVGFSGLACRHCYGGYGAGRFFPSTIKTLSDTSKTLNVLHKHMMRCRSCPQTVKETLGKLRARHDEERARLKFGSQKAFFGKIWSRLHEKTNFVAAGIHAPNTSGGMALPQAHNPQHGPKAVDGVAALSLAALHIAGMKRLSPSSQTSSSITEVTPAKSSAIAAVSAVANGTFPPPIDYLVPSGVPSPSSPSKPVIKRPRAA